MTYLSKCNFINLFKNKSEKNLIPTIIFKKQKSKEIKNIEDKSIQRLREEFNQNKNQKESHPRTSCGIKQYINNINNSAVQKFHNYKKSLSSNKYKTNIKLL